MKKLLMILGAGGGLYLLGKTQPAKTLVYNLEENMPLPVEAHTAKTLALYILALYGGYKFIGG